MARAALAVMRPVGVLMCPPTAFDVVDRKNPFMDPSHGVDRRAAQMQWEAVRDAFTATGMAVETMEPLAGVEDMVFCANPAFTGTDARGRRKAIASQMRHASRQREVDPQAVKLSSLGYAVEALPPGLLFEGGGDALWHLGQRRIWLGVGPRSGEAVAAHLERAFETEVIPLRLAGETFYHLDTALCVLDARTALVHAPALEASSYDELARRFERLVEIDEHEALIMAGNAARAGANSVIVERLARATGDTLRAMGYDVIEVDTSEFRKSGGSVYCMKQYLF